MSSEDSSSSGKDQSLPVYTDPNADRFGRAPPAYVPTMRSLEMVYNEDENAKDQYADIADNDEEIVVDNFYEEIIRLNNWDEMDFSKELRDNIHRAYYSHPRKIQSIVLPFVLDGYDVIVQAETGSGKTAAFLLPVIDACMVAMKDLTHSQKAFTPFAIILEPTREMVEQVYDQARKLVTKTQVTVSKSYGEFDLVMNYTSIARNGCDILITTTGRLCHFIELGCILLDGVKFFVLDEGDRMLDRNFLRDIERIVAGHNFPSSEHRQTLFFSATYSASILQIAHKYCRKEAVLITNFRTTPNAKIFQEFVVVEQNQRFTKLLEIMKEKLRQSGGLVYKIPRTLVFVNRKEKSDLVAAYLGENGIPALPINSSRPQDIRQGNINKFRDHGICVLVATDVCARGIDIKNLDYVINFDMPDDLATYTFRIGRTGRIKVGEATSFVSASDKHFLETLRDTMVNEGVFIPDSLEDVLDSKILDIVVPQGGKLIAAIDAVKAEEETSKANVEKSKEKNSVTEEETAEEENVDWDSD